jgi:hypothetical protein
MLDDGSQIRRVAMGVNDTATKTVVFIFYVNSWNAVSVQLRKRVSFSQIVKLERSERQTAR